ncbi:ATP-binding protein [Enterorhabdus sp. NM05_H27]|uniref:ATP-binding protein n=1 Tax=Adlercreutzia muris TaxID=1796610 RepID=UPI001094A9FD|nr:AAA family ATPase [Adlercreutzia muris]TGY75447.1 ATP-binding protein [Enterorhabdus sp. NM05_H27]
MFRRKAYENLKEWKTLSRGTTAVLIEGARRVGKTTLVKQFAANEYKDSLYIDFSKAAPDVLRLFQEQREDIDTFLRMLQLNYGKSLPVRDAVVIFDEVQRFPPAREYIKHLVADGRFDYIETGSLISIKKNVEDIVIPSEEDRITLHPMDFEEYLWAMDGAVYADAIREARSSLVALPDGAHAKLSRLFNEYMLVGGMPQSVASFLEEKSFEGCARIKRRILSLYLDDIAKFGDAHSRRARAVFAAIPGQLSAASKRFKFSSLEGNARYEDYEPALDWLSEAHLVNLCRLCTDPKVGLRMNEEVASLKCYMADTGLLVSHGFADGPASKGVHRDIQFGRVSVNKGMLAENVVAQQLRAAGHELFYHAWSEDGLTEGARPRAREVDFLTTQTYDNAGGKLRITPVEVKSSKSYRTVSLDAFRDRFRKHVGKEIVLHPKQLAREGEREYLPLYMAFCL